MDTEPVADMSVVIEQREILHRILQPVRTSGHGSWKMLDLVRWFDMCPSHDAMLYVQIPSICNLQHDNADTIHLRLVDLVVLIHTAAKLRGSPVEKIEVKLAITRFELVVFEEQRVVE